MSFAGCMHSHSLVQIGLKCHRTALLVGQLLREVLGPLQRLGKMFVKTGNVRLELLDPIVVAVDSKV